MTEEKYKLNIIADSFNGFEFVIDPDSIHVIEQPDKEDYIIDVVAKYKTSKYLIHFSNVKKELKTSIIKYLKKIQKVNLLIDKDDFFSLKDFSASAYLLITKKGYDTRIDLGKIDVLRDSDERPDVD